MSRYVKTERPYLGILEEENPRGYWATEGMTCGECPFHIPLPGDSAHLKCQVSGTEGRRYEDLACNEVRRLIRYAQ